jgi:tetratricopeptide (TPR) repeat protein
MALPPRDPETVTFMSLLDIDPHQRLDQVEQEIAGLQPEELFSRGLEALTKGDSLYALACLERAAGDISTPELLSNLGFCLAKERAQFDRAVELCSQAIDQQPASTSFYLNLGRVHLMMGNKKLAIDTYQEGLRHGDDPRIREDLQLLGIRRRPLLKKLDREHPLNRSLGYLLRNRPPKK